MVDSVKINNNFFYFSRIIAYPLIYYSFYKFSKRHYLNDIFKNDWAFTCFLRTSVTVFILECIVNTKYIHSKEL